MKAAQTYRQEKSKLYETTNDYAIECIRWPFLPFNELANSQPSIVNICIKQVMIQNK